MYMYKYKVCKHVSEGFLSVCMQGIMLVYDVTSEKTFDNIRNWIRNIEEVGPACFLMHKLVGDNC